MFKIGVYYDDESTKNDYFAYFNDIEGIDGDNIVDIKSDTYQINKRNLKIKLSRADKRSVNRAFRKHLSRCF